jgi:plasmid stabilization system protein ParE
LLDLGSKFIEAADIALSRIADNPEMYAVGYRGIRRAKLPRFPHVVYYRIIGATIEILAVLHGRRRPRTVASRI